MKNEHETSEMSEMSNDTSTKHQRRKQFKYRVRKFSQQEINAVVFRGSNQIGIVIRSGFVTIKIYF